MGNSTLEDSYNLLKDRIYALGDPLEHGIVEDVYIDTDCLPEGTLTVHVTLNDYYTNEICALEGYNTEDWEEDEEEE